MLAEALEDSAPGLVPYTTCGWLAFLVCHCTLILVASVSGTTLTPVGELGAELVMTGVLAFTTPELT